MRRRRADLAVITGLILMFSLLPGPNTTGAPSAGQVTTIPGWRLQTSRTATQPAGTHTFPQAHGDVPHR